MKKLIFISLFLICQSVLSKGQINYSSIIDSTFLSKIPYDSASAINDIKEKNIRILILQSAYGPIGDPINTNEEFDYIEKRFGFKFHYEGFEIPIEFLARKQDEYNNQVYKHLDSIIGIDVKKAIRYEQVRLLFERVIISNEPEKKIKKRIQKCIRKENKEIKSLILSGEIAYKNRSFQESLKIYQDILVQAKTIETKKFLLTSIYHCYLNLARFDEAADLVKNNDPDLINTKIKRMKNSHNRIDD